MKLLKILSYVWIISLIIISPIVFILGGWPLLVAYLTCKFSGFCPI